MSTEVVTAVLEAYGIWGLILLIVALIGLALFINYVSRVSFANILSRTGKSKEPFIDMSLCDNWFFANAKYKMRFDIPSLQLNPDNVGLNHVYKDLIYLNVESFYYGCKRLVETHDMTSMNGSEWEHMVKTELQSMTTTFIDKAEDLKVPSVIINKYSKWMKPYITLLNTHIEQLGNSAMYGEASSLRMHVFLFIMNLLIVVMIGDLDKIAREPDPELEGIHYRELPLY